MVRDVQTYTSNHWADSLSPERAVAKAVGDLSAIELLEQICETTYRDLGLGPAGSTPANDAPGTSGGTPEEDSPAPPGGVSPRRRSTMRLLLDRHLVRRRGLVHRPLVLLCLVLRRRVVLCVDAVRLVVDEVPR